MNGDLDARNAARYRDEGFEHLTLPTNREWRGAAGVEDKLDTLDRLAGDLELR